MKEDVRLLLRAAGKDSLRWCKAEEASFICAKT